MATMAQVPRPEDVPFLDPASLDTNVVLHVVNFSAGVPCPPVYTNRLNNTNLFSRGQTTSILEALSKYWTVTTNVGPPGTVLTSLYPTNIPTPTNLPLRVSTKPFISKMVGVFKYTNCESTEVLRFSSGLAADYVNPSGTGYHVSITRTASGTLFSFAETVAGHANGIAVRLTDSYHQGLEWDFRRAKPADFVLIELKHITNGLAIGPWFMWNPETGRLGFHVEFKQPYDLVKHSRIPGRN
jgi:hypothetical protein